MEADASNHPDEGTIHAWLDDALDPAEAARIAEHVRGCADCSARVAEARGLIAGASRIIGALDDVPAGSRPAWSQEGVVAGGAAASTAARTGAETTAGHGSLWRRLRVTPARSAIAATLIVALGITLTRQRVAIDTPEMARVASAPAPAVRADSVAGQGAAADAPLADSRSAARESDHLLDSAVAKSLAIAHPPRALNAAPGVAIPQAPASAGSALAPDTLASLQVAAGRNAIRAERVEGAAQRADKARVGAYAAAAAPPAATEALDAVRSADEVARTRTRAAVADVAPSSSVAGARQCYLLESRVAGATWGGESLPLVVAVDSAARTGASAATVYSAAGARTPARARWTRAGRDSVVLSLSRIGFAGTIALGAELAGGRTGLARSAPVTQRLQEVVTTESSSADRQLAKEGERRADARAQTRIPAPSASGLAAPAPAQPPMPMRELPVTMRAAACPNP